MTKASCGRKPLFICHALARARSFVIGFMRRAAGAPAPWKTDMKPNIIVIAILMSACTPSAPPPISPALPASTPSTPHPAAPAADPPPGPIVGLDGLTLPPAQAATLRQASADFQAVLQGKPPVHARADDSAPLAADGGTQTYVGAGYRLTVVQSLSSLGPVDGFVYGPVLVFDKALARGNTRELSDLRFYPLDRFKAFRNAAAR